MNLLITPAAWIIRRGDSTEHYGDPYTDTAIITRIGNTAHIEAWSGGAPTPAECRKLADELKHHGITHVQWERRTNGRVRHVCWKL